MRRIPLSLNFNAELSTKFNMGNLLIIPLSFKNGVILYRFPESLECKNRLLKKYYFF